jgi:hypothetical protein
MQLQPKVFLAWLSLSSASAWTGVSHGAPASSRSRSSRLFSAASYDSSSDNNNLNHNNYNHNNNPFELTEGDHLQRPGAMQYDSWNTSSQNRRSTPNNNNNNNNYIPPRPPSSHWQHTHTDPYMQQPKEPQFFHPPPLGPQNYDADGWQAGPPVGGSNPGNVNPPLPWGAAPEFDGPAGTTSSGMYRYGGTNAPGLFGNNPSTSTSTLPTSDRQGFLEGIQRFEEQAMAAATAATSSNNNNNNKDPDQAATREFLEETFGRLEQSLNLRLDSNRDIYDDLWDEAYRIYQNLQRMDTNQKLDYLWSPFRSFLDKLQDRSPNLLPSANNNNNYNNRPSSPGNFNNNRNNRANPGMNNRMGPQRPTAPNTSMGMQRPNPMNRPNTPNTMGMPNQPNTFNSQPNTMGMTSQPNNNNALFQRNSNHGFTSNNNSMPNAMGNMPNKPTPSFQGNTNEGFTMSNIPNGGMPNPPNNNLQPRQPGMPNQPNTFAPTPNAFPNNNNMPNSFPATNGSQGVNNGMPNGMPNRPNQPNTFSPTPNAFPGTTQANSFTTPQTEGRNDAGAWQ